MIKVMHSCLFPPRKVLVTLSPHPTGGIGPLYCTKHTLGRPRFVSQLQAGSTGIVIVIVIAVVKQGILVNIRARGPPRRRRRVCVDVVHVQQHGVLPGRSSKPGGRTQPLPPRSNRRVFRRRGGGGDGGGREPRRRRRRVAVFVAPADCRSRTDVRPRVPGVTVGHVGNVRRGGLEGPGRNQASVEQPVLVRAHVRAGGAARLVIVERAILASSSFALGGRVGGGRGRGEGGRGRGRPRGGGRAAVVVVVADLYLLPAHYHPQVRRRRRALPVPNDRPPGRGETDSRFVPPMDDGGRQLLWRMVTWNPPPGPTSSALSPFFGSVTRTSTQNHHRSCSFRRSSSRTRN